MGECSMYRERNCFGASLLSENLLAGSLLWGNDVDSVTAPKIWASCPRQQKLRPPFLGFLVTGILLIALWLVYEFNGQHFMFDGEEVVECQNN